MIKKLVIGTAAAALIAGFFFGRDAWSYVGTSACWVKDSVRDSVPIEFEIERARKMVRELEPAIRKQMHVIAREEVELERLQREITDVAATLDRERGHIERLTSDLQSGDDVFKYANRTFTAEQVRTDLANRFKRYKTKNETLASLREIRDARDSSVQAARDNLEGMRVAKRQLEVEVENIEARRKMVLAANVTSGYHFDDSQLSRVRELVSDLQARLDVEARVAEATIDYDGEIPLGDEVPDDLVEQVTQYFADPGEEAIASKPTSDVN